MRIFLLLLLLSLCGISDATTYYISPTGNDVTGNGTFANPWKTLVKATSTVTTNGDIIHVNAGTFTETAQSTLAVGVSIEGDGVTSIIRAGYAANPLINATSGSEGINGNQHISNVKFDGNSLTGLEAIRIYARSNVVIHDCTFTNFGNAGIFFGGRTDDADAPPAIYATGNQFYNNIVTNCSIYATYGHGALNVGGQQSMLIHHNTMTQTGRTAGENGYLIKYFCDGWNPGLKIYNNNITKEPYDGFTFDFAIELWGNTLGGLEIYNNNIIGNTDLLHLAKGSYTYSVDFHDNIVGPATINTNAEAGFEIEADCSDVLVRNNTFKNLAYGIFSFNQVSYTHTRVTIKNNLFIGARMNDFDSWFNTGTCSYWNIWNNTLDANGIITSDGITVSGAGICTNFSIKNNIIKGYARSPIFAWLVQAGATISNLQIQNNNFYNNGNNNNPLWQNINPVNVTTANNITANPLFVGGTDYTLQGSSPCIDAGINVGLPYNGNAPDIGYAEYGGVSIPPPLVGTIAQPTCAVATGSVVLSNLPATGTWTLIRTPGGTTTAGSGTSTTISGLAAGTYSYTVTNASGTSAPSSNILINTQPATPSTPTIGTITQPTCAVATGSVVLSNLPATGTWTLIRTPGGTTTAGSGTSTTISGLAAGTYSYTVTNASGCISAASANMVINTQPATPSTPTIGTITQPTCAVATGSVVLSNLPATGTWTLLRTPGGTTTAGSGTSTTISGLAAGTYSYTVTNASGCNSAASANMVINTQPATPSTPTIGTITQPTCAVATGSVVLSNLPATGTWTLLRTPGGTTTAGSGTSTTISGLAAGTYSYTVTNASGCNSAASANMVINTQPATPSTPTIGTITQPTCAVATGSVVLSNLPATGTWTLTRTPGGTTTAGSGTSTTISGLAAGTYSYTVTNASGCNSAASANMVINAQPATPSTPTIGTITQPTCAVATGSVVLSNLPATGTWTLTRTPGGTTTAGSGTSTTISGLAAGTYSYTVTNASGCNSAASANMVINAQPATPSTPTIGTITQPTCAVATGSVVLSNLPATGTWTLIRTPGGTTTAGSGTSTTISGLAAGTYSYTVTNASGCNSAASANMVINAQPAIPSTPTIGTITQPTAVVATGSVVLSSLPATGTWTLTRTPGGTTTAGSGTSTTITGLAAGTYSYTVTNASGCISAASADVVIIAAANIPPAANAGADQTITLPDALSTNSINLSGTGTDPDGTITAYLWIKISGPAAGTITSPNAASTSVTGLVQGVYNFELRVTDNSGAVGSDVTNISLIVSANIPPAANAGSDQTITFPDNATSLTGAGTDIDGTIVGYDWKQISGPSNNVLFSLHNAVTFVNDLVEGVYQFELTVTDNRGGKGVDTVSVVMEIPHNAIYNNSIKIYPNPVVNITTLEITKEKVNTKVLMLITDVQGKTISTKELASLQNNFVEKINMSNLAEAVYLVTVFFDDTEKRTLKVIKTN